MIDFRKLVTALEAHPDIWLARAQFLPGASASSIERAENRLGVSLNPEVKAFYQHHNGLAIQWMFKHCNRFQNTEYNVDTSELPFWMDLMDHSGIPFDGQIIMPPIGEVFISSYEDIEEPSDFDPECAYTEYFRDPPMPAEGPFILGERQFESEAAFRTQLRIFDNYLSEYGNLMLFERGKSDPDLLHCDDIWDNFDSRMVLPLSQYIHHVAYNFGLRWYRWLYFRDAEPAPISFDPEARLVQLIAETKFPGDLRTNSD